MEQNLSQLHQILEKLVGFHRHLLETVRLEKEALVTANKKALQDIVSSKEAQIESIRMQEQTRIHLVSQLARHWGMEPNELSLSKLIIRVQGFDLKKSELLRSAHQALLILIGRIKDQNHYNGQLVERSMEHIQNMKTNILGEKTKQSITYTQSGKKTNSSPGARLISREV